MPIRIRLLHRQTMRPRLPKLPRPSLPHKKPDAMALAAGNPRLEAAVARSRKLVRRRALGAAVASAVPLPGLDWAVDAALLGQLLPEVNRQFGLAPAQISQLSTPDKEQVQKMAAMAGSILVGRNITQKLVLRFAQTVGMRLTVAQASKYVPLAGQAVAGVLGYSVLTFLAEQHIRDCVRVARAVPALAAPLPNNAHNRPGATNTPLAALPAPDDSAPEAG